jgi:hypothetical protein
MKICKITKMFECMGLGKRTIEQKKNKKKNPIGLSRMPRSLENA